MINIAELIKVYPGPVPALRGIDLKIDRGMFGLLGPNGAGKSTLMKIMAGLLVPTSGSVQFDSFDVVTNPNEIWQTLGYLPQDFGFYPGSTGREMLIYLLRLKGVKCSGGLKSLADQLLDRVNLSFAANRKVKTYSGGMKQRLGIAQAIAGDPRLVIVDEPTAGLDPEERLRLYQILATIAEDRIVILSTHNVDDVSFLCSKFAVISDGKIISSTTPVAAISEIEGTLLEGEASTNQLPQIAKDHRVVRAIVVAGQNRIRIQSGDGPTPAGFRPVNATLEDAYLLMMNGRTGWRESVSNNDLGA